MNQLATIQPEDKLLFEPQNLTKDTIKKYLCASASDQELMMGLQIAKTFNLNPLKREVYFVKYGTSPMQVLTGYEVYLKRAERSGQYNGLDISSQGSVETGDLKAIVKVYRKDWTNPLTHEVDYNEYVQKKHDGTVNTFWKNKPKTMIKKVAVSQAFRLAFPDEFDGMPYTSDEVVDQDKIIDIAPPPEVKEMVGLTPQVDLLIEKGKKAFKNRSALESWLFMSFKTTDPNKLSSEDLNKACDILCTSVDNNIPIKQ